MSERQQPEGTGYRGYWATGAVGCLAFALSFAVCSVCSVVVAHLATRDLDRSEVFSAIHADTVLAQWCCGGLVVSAGVSLVVAGAASGLGWRVGRELSAGRGDR